ncbi:MAG: MlaD family protein [Pseudomonadota bacterium]
METRANYALVGFFVLTLLIGILGFTVWISRVDWTQGSIYEINFEGSVAGLRENETVTYNGVPIGSVMSIAVNPEKVNLIRVLVEIDRPSLIRENSFATLQGRGITGQIQIKIDGSTPDSPILLSSESQKPPEIPSRTSGFQQVIEEAPRIMEKLIRLVNDVTPVFNEKNREAFASTLENFATFSEILAKESQNMAELLTQTKQSFKQFEEAMQEMKKMIAENRPAIKQFTEGGLKEFSSFMQEWRVAAKNLNRVVEKFERNPLQFIVHSDLGGQELSE